MKIKTDFITNSSSSSFIAFGVSKYSILENIDYEKTFEDILNNEEKSLELMTLDEYDKETLMTNYILDKLLDKNLEVGGYDNDQIGIPLSKVIRYYSDIPLSEVFEIISNTINEICGLNVRPDDIGYIEEVWMG